MKTFSRGNVAVMASPEAASRSVHDQRTAAFRETPKCLIARDNAENLVIVPRLAVLRGRLYLREQHVVDEPAVLADAPVPGIEVIYRQLAHLDHHVFLIIRPHRRYRRYAYPARCIAARLRHGRHPA